MIRRSLLDLNVVIALTEPGHSHYRAAHRWLASNGGSSWGFCAFTETGFVRVTTNVNYRPSPRSCRQATDILEEMKKYPGYFHWKIEESWAEAVAPFASRIYGHQQVTDAYLLGMAIQRDGILVTFDKGLRYLAGPEFAQHLAIIK